MNEKEFDAALSFAGEDREAAEELAEALKDLNIRVFYDKYEKADLWGVELYEHLTDVYKNRAHYCVMFLSEHYARKLWTNHERRAAQARAFEENREYILPIRLDDTKIPGILPTVGYLSWQDETAESVARMVVDKLGKLLKTEKARFAETKNLNQAIEPPVALYSKQTRTRHLREHLAEDSALLKEYEDSLRLEDDPRGRAKCEREIERIKSSIAKYETELRELK